MDPSEAYGFNASRRRRDNVKRQRVEATVERLTRRYGLRPQTAQALCEEIYGLYRNLVGQKALDDQDRYYRNSMHRAEHYLAAWTANAAGAEVSGYVTDVRDHAARMIWLDTLERRNLGRGRAIEKASKVTWAHLSPQQRRKARRYLAGNVLPGDNTRQPAREVEFLKSVAGLIAQATEARISFSSRAPGSRLPSRPRHHSVEFDVMMAAAEMADYPLSNEAMARRVQRIRRHNPRSSS